MFRNGLTLALALAIPTLTGAATIAGRAAAAPAVQLEAIPVSVTTQAKSGDGRVGQEVIVIAAPPPPRFEVVGAAPSPRHFWISGYHRFTGREYIWTPGRWEIRREGYRYQEARYERFGAGFRFHEACWVHL